MRQEPISFSGEPLANAARLRIAEQEPISLRTATPTQTVIERSAGLFHFTPDGRKLADFTSGVLVANLGHNPRAWWARLAHHMGWTPATFADGEGYVELPPLTAYNAISGLEDAANRRLLASLRRTPHGGRLEQVMWSASGSEGVQKAIWACLAASPGRDLILATRNGFHGKKGLAEAVTGDENSPNRDPRVRFIGFPRDACRDIDQRGEPFDVAPVAAELDDLWRQTEGRIACLITEPYLGGGGSFHPPREYLRFLATFCQERRIAFILDEVQANFGRTGEMYAFETYGVAPDIVVLGKGMGNGVPVNAAVGSAEFLGSLGFGGASDTWSGHPLGCAATLATLDIFESQDILGHARKVSTIVEAGLRHLKELPIVAAVRGEGMVWGVELEDRGPEWPSKRVATECVRACYLGDDAGDAIHLLGPLAGNVIRISPPLTMTEVEAEHYLGVMRRCFAKVAAVSGST